MKFKRKINRNSIINVNQSKSNKLCCILSLKLEFSFLNPIFPHGF